MRKLRQSLKKNINGISDGLPLGKNKLDDEGIPSTHREPETAPSSN
jgi:hypothetical protein